jgi:hypothetical protein|tara:strand:- start:811 stop:1026 length:216 start_codon:yes stop_codon:yes gene_type:complete
MYELLKKLTPKAFIKKNETTIRLLLSLFYRGNRFKCCVCEFEMSRFITSKKEINFVQNVEVFHEQEDYGSF